MQFLLSRARRLAGPGGRPAPVAAALGLFLLLLTALPLGAGSTTAAPLTRASSAPAALVPRGAVENVSTSIVSTIEPLLNASVAGAASPTAQSDPDQAIVGGAHDDLYVRGQTGTVLDVIDPYTDRVVAALAVPPARAPRVVQTMALDPASGILFLADPTAGNVTLVNTTTNTVSGEVALGGNPTTIAFDNTTGDVYVVNPSGNNVSVLNGSNGTELTTIGVGSNPGAVVYDYVDRDIFVADPAGGTSDANVTVIDATREKTVASIPVGALPDALAFSPSDDLLWVANYNSNNVTEYLARTGALNGTFSMGGGTPIAIALDPTFDEVLVANQVVSNVTAIDALTGTTMGQLTVPDSPTSLALDPVSGDLFVTSPGSDAVAVLRALGPGPIADIDLGNAPETVAFAPTSGTALVVNAAQGHAAPNVTEVRATGSAVLGEFPLTADPGPIVADPDAGAMAVTEVNGSRTYLLGPANGTINATLSGGVGAALTDRAAYDPTTSTLFEINPGDDNLSVFGPSGALPTSVALGAEPTAIVSDPGVGGVVVAENRSTDCALVAVDDSTFALTTEASLPLPCAISSLLDAWSMIVVANAAGGNLTFYNSTSFVPWTTVGVGSAPSDLAADPSTQDPNNANSSYVTVVVANAGSANVSVLTTTGLGGLPTVLTTLSLPGERPTRLDYNPTHDAVFVGSSTGTLTMFNASTFSDLDANVTTPDGAPITGLASDALTGQIWLSCARFGVVYAVNVTVAVPQNVPISFVESGLPAGTTWTIDLGSQSNSSTTPTIGFHASIGLDNYSVPSTDGYVAIPSSGAVNVSTANRTFAIAFYPGPASVFTVTFTQTTLPGSTPWWVWLNSTTSGSASILYSSSESLAFYVPNGTYEYSAGAPNYTAEPASGPVNLTGTNLTEPLTFLSTPVHETFDASLAANDSTIPLGESVTFTTSTLGGIVPFQFAYVLPPGCPTTGTDSSVVACQPSQEGTFTVSVTVTDGNGTTANASTTLTVDPPSTSTPPSVHTKPATTPAWEYVAIGIGVLALLLAVAAVLLGRRRPPAAEPDSAPASSATDPADATGPPE